MPRTLVLIVALVGLTVAGLSRTVAAQEVPGWVRAPEIQSDPPSDPPPPPPDPPQVPIDGGLVWLALAGGGYAAYRLRRAQRDA